MSSGPVGGGAVRPLAFGYWAQSAVSAGEANATSALAWQEQIATVARSEGYCLAGVFTDVQGHTEQGLYAMVKALGRGAAVAVITPELSHLQHAGCLRGADLVAVAQFLRSRLIVAGFCCGATMGSALVSEAVGA